MGAMPDEPPFSRREGDTLARRLDEIDRHGTRGMQLLQMQTQANTDSLGQLKNEITTRFAEHTRQHETELAELKKRRRYRITVTIAAGATLAAILGVLWNISATLAHLHP